MAMILDAFVSKCSAVLADFVQEEVVMLLGVKDELQKLQEQMLHIRKVLEDAEKRKLGDEDIDLWLSELKDVMYDADDIIDLCRIEGAQLLADQTPQSTSTTSPVCCNFSSAFSCFTSVPLRHEIGNRIKQLNDRLDRIYKNSKRFKLHKSKKSETTQVDNRQTSSMIDPLIVGREVEDDANKLVDLLVEEKVEEKCRLFAVVGMGGIGKTTLAQKIYNHPKIQTYFHLKAWACVSQTYSETDLLKQVIRGAKGSYRDDNTKSELQPILRDSVNSGQNFFLVLDDVWGADVWVDLLRIPLSDIKTSVRVLVTTRSEIVATSMRDAHIHYVTQLSIESSWDMLRVRLFSDREEELANDFKELGIKIVENCKRLPLAIKVIAGVLFTKERTKKVWDNFLKNDAWSISKLPEELKGALYLSFDELPQHLKQCFLYFSLYPEDAELYRGKFALIWVAEGFVTERQDSLMEDLAKEYFNELLKRNLLLPDPSNPSGESYKMHDLVRSLVLYLAKEETSFGDMNVKVSTTSTKLRRLSVKHEEETATTKILDFVANQGALRTLHASQSNLLLDDKRLRQLSHLRVLDISSTRIEILPDSIGNLVHLRYLDLSYTSIRAIPESIEHLANLQFLMLQNCDELTQLPSGITRLHNLRYLDFSYTPLSFIPKGIGKLQHLNNLSGFVAANNDSSSKLEDLNSLKQMRNLSIRDLKSAQSEAIILKELCFLSNLWLDFIESSMGASEEEQLAVEKLFDQLIPPQSLEKLHLSDFFGGRFPNWMMPSSSFEKSFPFLTALYFESITSCTELPPLGQLPELKLLSISLVSKVKKIGPEFLGGGINSTMRIAFPKLEEFYIEHMLALEEWSFGAQVKQNASPMFKLLPHLQKLDINSCPLLKQLPQGLKYSAMKSLSIFYMDSLKSMDDLPEIEVLQIFSNKNLEKVCCLPSLKHLEVSFCEALSCVEKLDALQELKIVDPNMMSLPKWLLMLLQQRELQKLELWCSEKAFRECVKEGSYWDLIQHIPQVTAWDGHGHYLRYSKQPDVYDTNL